MIYAAILALMMLLCVNHFIARNALYPPSLFTAVWLVSLSALALSGDTFYPISIETMMVFLVGAIAFSLGGLAAHRPLTSPVSVESRISRSRLFLDLAFLVVVVGFPFFARSLIADGIDLQAMRQEEVASRESSRRDFGFMENLVVLAAFVAIAMHVENDGTRSRRWRAYLAILLALTYSALTGSKSGIRLILVLMFISAIQAGFLSFRSTAKWMALFVGLFAAGLLLVNFAYMGFEFSEETLPLLFGAIQNYWLGSMVAFERIVQDPNAIIGHHTLSRFFLETANGFGARFEIPSIHAPFTSVSPDQEMNTYTIYFSYIKDYGWLGIILGMAMLGVIVTTVYNAAQRGSKIAIAFFGVFAMGLVMSIQAEQFVLALNSYIKMFLFFAFAYFTLPRPVIPSVSRGEFQRSIR